MAYVTVVYNFPSSSSPNNPDTLILRDSRPQPSNTLIDGNYSPNIILSKTLISMPGSIYLPSKLADTKPNNNPTQNPVNNSGPADFIITTPAQLNQQSFWDGRIDLGSYTIVPSFREPSGAPKRSSDSNVFRLSATIYTILFSIDSLVASAATLARNSRDLSTLSPT